MHISRVCGPIFIQIKHIKHAGAWKYGIYAVPRIIMILSHLMSRDAKTLHFSEFFYGVYK